MWHLKTKSGTFWIVKKNHQDEKYTLGCDEQDLGGYSSLKAAVVDVCNQETGHLKWDEQLRAQAPVEVEHWEQGAPEGW